MCVHLLGGSHNRLGESDGDDNVDGDGDGDDNGDGFGNGDGGFDDDSNDGEDIQVPMNRVVVGTAPSPNLTVSQAR